MTCKGFKLKKENNNTSKILKSDFPIKQTVLK